MVRKWLTVVIAVVAIAALGWACGDDDNEAETPSPTGGSPTVTESGGLSGKLEIFS